MPPDGGIHVRLCEESTDAETIEFFIETHLSSCSHWPEPKSVLVMDNVSFH